MGRKDILKQVFHNVLHQKSMEQMEHRRNQEPDSRSASTSFKNLPQSEQSCSTALEDTTLETISECHTYTDLRVNAVLKEMEKVEAAGTAVMNAAEAEAPDNFDRLLRQAELMTTAHLDTIETTITILAAIKNLSPHVRETEREMLEKKQRCEKKLEQLKLLLGLAPKGT